MSLSLIAAELATQPWLVFCCGRYEGIDARVIDAWADDEISIVTDGSLLDADTAVEVRSRFHDRWISGFSIAEAVDTPGRCRYRLTRLSDGIPLPILFEACDVRAASNAHGRNGASASRAPLNESRIRS